ncbi:MAG: glycosyltransferase, partial [Solirubrobacterales bacterium]|nr:glycosyltransferase [Solirubrobacterales bacterium]
MSISLPLSAPVDAPEALGSIAIVHDYLNQPGGAERVVLAMAAIWPDAPIYTSLYRAGSTFPGFGAANVQVTGLHWLPVDRGFRNLFPLYPAAFRSFGPLEHDVVISSSSGWAHSVRTGPDTFHAVYCYTPARWLYGGEYLGADRRKALLRPVVGRMQRWDRHAAGRAHLYIAISQEVRRRIARQYGVDAPVVYPPVDVDRFRPRPRGERLLVVSRLLPYKRVDAIVDVATRAGIGLDVVGTGPALDDLRRRAGSTVAFHGRLGDDEVTELMEACRALCVLAKEDFGITPVEANAAGKPVVAFGAGGALETVVDGVTGSFFPRHEADEILAAIRRCDAIDAQPEELAAAARRFSPRAFEAGLLAALHEGVRAHREQTARVGSRRPAGEPTVAGPDTSTAAPRPLMLGMGWFPDQPGGLDRYYRDLLEHLPEANGVLIGAAASVPGRVTGVSEHEQPLAQRLLAFWRAAQRAADGADVVDAHFALYALAPLLVGRLRGKPAVLHFHGPWAAENVSDDPSSLRRTVRWLVERAAYRRAEEVIVLSSAFRQVLVERYGVSPWTVTVEPPGVDLERFSPAPMADARRRLSLPAEGFVAVAVRRLVARMGLELLVQAWARAIEGLPEPSTLLIAGDGALRRSVEQAIAANGVQDSVRLLGRVSDARLVDCYRAADVAVVPSLEHEGFGLVVIEAAACGTPSIVTDVGGLPETVAGLDPSLIVPAGDRNALRDRLLRAPAELPSREATRAYAERFHWPTVAQRHRAIVHRAALSARAPAGSARRRADRRRRDDQRLKVVYVDHVAQMSGGEIALLRLLPHLHRVQP